MLEVSCGISEWNRLEGNWRVGVEVIRMLKPQSCYYNGMMLSMKFWQSDSMGFQRFININLGIKDFKSKGSPQSISRKSLQLTYIPSSPFSDT